MITVQGLLCAPGALFLAAMHVWAVAVCCNMPTQLLLGYDDTVESVIGAQFCLPISVIAHCSMRALRFLALYRLQWRTCTGTSPLQSLRLWFQEIADFVFEPLLEICG